MRKSHIITSAPQHKKHSLITPQIKSQLTSPVENSISANQHVGNRKTFLRCVPPIDKANPSAYCRIFTLHTSYTNDMLDQSGEGCQNAQ